MKEKIKKIYASVFLAFFTYCFLGYFLSEVPDKVNFGTAFVRTTYLSMIVSAISGTIITSAILFMERKNIFYKWQKIIILIIGILTSISVSINSFMGIEILNLGYFFDLIIGVGCNLILLLIIFSIGNWIYRKLKTNKPLKKIINKSVNYCSNCGQKMNDNSNFCPSCGKKL